MKKIILNLLNKQKGYTIFIGDNLLEKIGSIYNLSNYSKIFIVTDQRVGSLFLDKMLSNLPVKATSIILPVGEKEKKINNIGKIWETMHNANCDRKSLILNLGGGVICDMGSFAASTYMRGIDFINIPTTLLAQVDASIGGKTGINFAKIKNLIGTFNQPIGTVIDVNTLTTLSKREFLSGFAEIIKHGLIKDKKYFEKVTSKHPLKFTQDKMIDIITESVKIKANFVKNDEIENSSRKTLNFGHTIGQAIEILSHETSNPFLHGEAISIGMVAAAKVSHLMGSLSPEELQKIKEVLTNAELPISIRKHYCVDKILKKMKSDKKNEKEKINFTLLQGIGKSNYNQVVPKNIIIEAIKYIFN